MINLLQKEKDLIIQQWKVQITQELPEIQINLYCKKGIDSVGMPEQEKAMAHPYVETIKKSLE